MEPPAATPPPAPLDYPIIAVGDLHGQTAFLDRLVAKLRELPEWPAARLALLGDIVDRGPDVKGTVQRVMDLIAERPGSVCVMGNHDLGLVKAAGLGGHQPEGWVKRYADNYDHVPTFRSYLGREPQYLSFDDWRADLRALHGAIPPGHRAFLAGLPWVAEAAGHVFLHNGLSPELDCRAAVQLHCLHRKLWDRAVVSPRIGTDTARLFNPDYPVWLGADKKLSAAPLPLPGKVQVTGHVRIDAPDANAVRIRIDTSGGKAEPLTACLLRGPGAEPVFIHSS